MKLTEELVLQRTKAKSLEEVRSLNMWGQDISDVDILLRMPNVEVLSLSVNGISSLSSFRKCVKLRELYLRKNDVKNLADIQYLASINCLKILWLSDNPCAETLHYRATVVQYLPNLEKLDNVDVTDRERLEANSGSLMLPRLDSLDQSSVLDSPRLGASRVGAVVAQHHTPSKAAEAAMEAQSAANPLTDARKEGKEGTNDGLPSAGDASSPHVLYAVIALLEELDEDSLRIVKAEVDSRLGSS
ncbi:cilia- and flagella-associated protein [Chloropicon primus]|uniref:Leucine-rich repeat domain-containing protein n=1 Tax=Chloropicon primus TaxID=1764295 RepID=A0A5B8MHS4_9CHLO|nr:hypothetical protein A3770_02p17230 [Chloropicon primus]UPQ98414.1 cilia- and flagella-associated protein [Chloropicon primus]|eukprot:QDZ19205.1 hypothetical protein A3770_02p17230 [Chloropicon primus]